MNRDTAHEERATQRVPARGSVRIGDGIHWGCGRIVDLSATGIRIEADGAWRVGSAVVIDVCLDEAPMRHFSLTGSVRRTRGHTLAVELDSMPAAFEAYLVDALVAADLGDALPQVMLVDRDSPDRAAVAAAFRDEGWGVTEVSTPLEAIRQLADDRYAPEAIAIADTFPEAVAEELRELLAAEYPAHRIVCAHAARAQPAGTRYPRRH